MMSRRFFFIGFFRAALFFMLPISLFSASKPNDVDKFLDLADIEKNDSLKANFIRKAHIYCINSFNFEKADSLFEEKEKFLTTVPSEYAVMLRQTAWGNYLRGKYDVGDQFIKEAFEIRKDSSFIMTTLLGNANFSYLKGDYFRSLEELNSCLSFFERSDTTSQEAHARLGSLQNMIGFNLNDLGFFKKAIPHFEKAKSYAKKSGRTDTEVVSVKFITKLCLDLGLYEKALNNLADYQKEITVHPDLWQAMAIVYHKIGAYTQSDSIMKKWGAAVASEKLLAVNFYDVSAELYLQKKEPEKAFPFIKKYSEIAGNSELIKLEADQYLSRYYLQIEKLDSAEFHAGRILVRASGFRTERLKGKALILLAKAEEAKGNLFKAQHHFEEALGIFKKLEQPQNILICNKSLAELHEKRGNLKESLKFQKAYFSGKDSLELNSISKSLLKNMMQTLGKDVELSKADYEAQTEQLAFAQSKNRLFAVLILSALLCLFYFYKRLGKSKNSINQKEKALQSYRAKLSKLEEEQHALRKNQAVNAAELQIHAKRYIELNNQIDKISTQFNLKLHSKSAPSIRELRAMKLQLDNLIPKKNTWDDLLLQFNRLYPGFSEKLNSIGVKTPTMIRHAVCLTMNLSLRDSSRLLDISESGVKKARNRIRKELVIPSDKNLADFFQNL